MCNPDDEAEFRTSRLHGRVFTAIVWIESPGSRWSLEEKRMAERAVRSAEAWIMRQAQHWGTNLKFVTDARRHFVARLPKLPRGYGAGEDHDVEAWIDLITPYVDWRSPGEFLTQVQIDMQVDHAHLLLLVRREGRSYAATSRGGQDEFDALSVAVCFFDGDGTGVLPATVAHELLHLYGAWDLYESPYNSRAQAAHAKRLFLNDIMQASSPSINELAVKDLTAWRLGWRHTGPSWFEYFAPLNAGDEHLTSSRIAPPSSFSPQGRYCKGGAATTWKRISEVALRLDGACRRCLGFVVDSLRYLKIHGTCRDGVNSSRLRSGGGRKPSASRRLFSTEQLLALDALDPSTLDRFSEVMTDVLREHSLQEAEQIARVRPSPPASGSLASLHGELMLEWAAIRRHVAAQGVAGGIEEERLRRATQEWMALVERTRCAQVAAHLAAVSEAFRRSVLILDSIQRRDSQGIKRSVLRFRHLERQMRV